MNKRKIDIRDSAGDIIKAMRKKTVSGNATALLC